jgi:hypothetical protein
VTGFIRDWPACARDISWGRHGPNAEHINLGKAVKMLNSSAANPTPSCLSPVQTRLASFRPFAQ